MSDTDTGPARIWYTRLTNYSGERFSSGTNGIVLTPGIKTCPSFNRLNAGWFIFGGEAGTEPAIGYAYNEVGFNCPQGKELGLGGIITHPAVAASGPLRPGGVVLVREHDVAAPSDLIAIGDSQLSAMDIPEIGTIAWTSSGFVDRFILDAALVDMGSNPAMNAGNPTAGARFIQKRHRGRWNMAFGDGHVQAFRSREIFDYHSDDMLKRWSRDHQVHPECRQGLP
jgi:prepilin-type processing-associated H-X9-DG protein